MLQKLLLLCFSNCNLNCPKSLSKPLVRSQTASCTTSQTASSTVGLSNWMLLSIYLSASNIWCKLPHEYLKTSSSRSHNLHPKLPCLPLKFPLKSLSNLLCSLKLPPELPQNCFFWVSQTAIKNAFITAWNASQTSCVLPPESLSLPPKWSPDLPLKLRNVS